MHNGNCIVEMHNENCKAEMDNDNYEMEIITCGNCKVQMHMQIVKWKCTMEIAHAN